MLNNEIDFEYLKERRIRNNPVFKLEKYLKEINELPCIDDERKFSNHGQLGHKPYKRLKQKEVLKRFIKVHGNLYHYEYVKYKNQKTPIRIICSTHGQFFMTPHSHWNGVGCPKCKKTKKLKKI